MDFHVGIIDDNSQDAQYNKFLVSAWAMAFKHKVDIHIYPSAEAFLFTWSSGNASYDVILLDIEMPGMNGVNLAKTVRQQNQASQIIFITGYPDYVAEGYDVSALHYLMKPVQEKRLSEVLQRAVACLEKAQRAVLFTVGGETQRVYVDDILTCEAFAHTTEVITVRGKYIAAESITLVEDMLGAGFVRCHRSYLIHLKRVQRLTKTEVVMDGGTSVPLSRRLYWAVNQAFISYHTGR